MEQYRFNQQEPYLDFEDQQELKSCYYCGNSTVSDLVHCVNKGCNQFFCNLIEVENGQSHICYHLITRSHNEVTLAEEEYELSCFLCDNRNIFTLMFEEFIEDDLHGGGLMNIPIICRNKCLNSEESFKQKKFQSIIEEETFVSAFVTQNGTGKPISLQQIEEIEGELSQGLVKNTECLGLAYVQKIKKKYESPEQFAKVFQPLLDLELECEVEREGKDTGFSIVPHWSEGFRKFFFEFNEEQTKFKLNDNVLLKGENFLCNGVVQGIRKIKEISVCLNESQVGNQNLTRLNIKIITCYGAYNRMTRGLEHFKMLNPGLRDFLLGLDVQLPSFYVGVRNDFTAPGLPKLNESQNAAVKKALESPICLIQGPPGTGKSITTASIVYHLSKEINRLSQSSQLQTEIEDLERKISEKSRMIDEYCLQVSFQNKLTEAIMIHQANQPDFSWKMQVCQRTVSGFKDKLNKAEQERQALLVKIDEVRQLLDNSQDHSDKKKVLVTAPSNIAVDQLVGRIALTGLSVVRLYSKSKEEADSKFSFHNLFLKELEKPQNSKVKELFNLQKNRELKDNFYALYKREEERVRISIFKNVHVVCTTCIGALDKRLRGLQFSKVVIDEACQAREPECLIPLMFGADHVIMVGDHYQLGPVIKSRTALSAGLQNSIFERMVDLNRQTQILQLQYRMHPDISEFPCWFFYSNLLLNGVSPADRNDPQARFDWPAGKKQFFCHIDKKEELSSTGRSYLNRAEAEIVVELVRKIGIDADIGVITFYDAQRVTISNYFNGKIGSNIEIASVDSFQGREKDYIILSCVRSNDRNGVGFLGSYKRLNVAITRARFGLIICGNAYTLRKSPYWRSLLIHLKKNDSIFVYKDGRFLQKCDVSFGWFRGSICHETFCYAD